MIQEEICLTTPSYEPLRKKNEVSHFIKEIIAEKGRLATNTN